MGCYTDQTADREVAAIAALKLDAQVLGNLDRYGGPKGTFLCFGSASERSENLPDHMTRSENLAAEISMRALLEDAGVIGRSLYSNLIQELKGAALMLVMSIERNSGFGM